MPGIGFRISDLKDIPLVNSSSNSYKIILDDTYLLSYSHTIYGVNYNKNNYKIPLKALRDDIKGYIGIENLGGRTGNFLKLWHGNWENKKVASKSYISSKIDDVENSYYIIKDLPLPYESEDLNNRGDRGEKEAIFLSDAAIPAVTSINTPLVKADPNNESNKIPTKKYIDERIASERIIEVYPEFYVRDYDCTYIIRSDDLKNAEKIVIRYPKTFNNRLLHNKIEFSLLLEGIESSSVWESALKNDIKIVAKDWNDNEIQVKWLNGFKADFSASHLYGHSRYIILRFENITNEIISIPIYEDKDGISYLKEYDTIANYDIFVLCENDLYKADGLKTINEKIAIDASFTSADKSLNVETITNGDKVTVDLSVNFPEEKEISIEGDNFISVNQDGSTWNLGLTNIDDLKTTPPKVSSTNSYITVDKVESENVIDYQLTFNKLDKSPYKKIKRINNEDILNIAESNDYVFYSDVSNLNFKFLDESLSDNNEIISIEFLYKTSESTTIEATCIDENKIVGWSMSDAAPTLVANRLYNISFLYLPNILGLPYSIIGRINWFKNLA